MESKKKKNEMRCAACGREFEFGADVIGMQEGVIGPRGFVPLADMELFCSEACAKGDEDKSETVRLSRRIP